MTMPKRAILAWWHIAGTRAATLIALVLWGWLPLVWLAVPSSALVEIRDVRVHGGVASIYRTYPLVDWLGLPRPFVRSIHTVRPLPSMMPVCVRDVSMRHESPSAVFDVSLRPWADECLSAPYEYRVEFRAYLFDLIPLRPESETVAVMDADIARADPACRYRVSTSGIIHAPDSPYWAMVPATNCYPTRAAAEAALAEARE
jgi:hypothetical protein